MFEKLMRMEDVGGEGLLYRLPEELEKSDYRHHGAVSCVFQVRLAQSLPLYRRQC